MNKKPQRRLTNDFLGRRVMERYRNARAVLRARVPLVLRRNGAPPASTAPLTCAQAGASRYRVSLHVHLSHFGWLSDRIVHAGVQHVAEWSTVTRTLSAARGRTLAAQAVRRGSARHDATRGPIAAPQALARVARSHVNVAPSGTSVHAGIAPAAAQPGMVPARWVLPGAPAAQTRNAALRGQDVGRRLMHDRGDGTPYILGRRTFEESLARRQGPPLIAASAQATVSGRSAPMSMYAQAARLQTGNRPSSWAAIDDHGTSTTRAIGREPRAHAEGRAARMSDLAPQAILRRSVREANDASRAPLYSQAASRNFANPPAPGATQQAPVRNEQRTVAVSSPSAPALDIAQLSDDVYRHIERRLRIERERRGL